MKGDAKEYLEDPGRGQPGRSGLEGRAPVPARVNGARRELLAGFRARAWEALRQRQISRGAFTYLSFLVEWAKEDGDGDSFVVGERTQELRTGYARMTIRSYRRQLTRSQLIKFERRWAFKRGWFYEAKTTLLFSPPSGLISSPESGLEISPESGLKTSPSLIGTSEGGTDEALPRAARSGLPHGAGKSSGLRPEETTGKEKTASKMTPGQRARQNTLLGMLRRLLPQGEFLNDAGKWGDRARENPRKVERVLADFAHRLKGGKPIEKTYAGALEDTWKRFT